jgi:hypothetical protein
LIGCEIEHELLGGLAVIGCASQLSCGKWAFSFVRTDRQSEAAMDSCSPARANARHNASNNKTNEKLKIDIRSKSSNKSCR